MGGVAFIGYGLYKCYRRKGKVDLASCFLTGAGETLIDSGIDLGKYAWNKGIRPVSEEIYKKGLKPVGKGIFNKALKPGYKQIKSLPKKLEHESQKAGKTTWKGVKKILSFGF